MKNSTVAIVKCALEADSDTSESQKRKVLQLLKTGDANLGLESLLLTIKEACGLLHCSRHTLWRLVQDNRLRPVKLRGLVRFRRGDILALANIAGMRGEVKP